MLINPETLSDNLDVLEGIEKASMRLVTQAIHNFRVDSATIFNNEKDLVGDIGEDLTREALDRLGMSKIEQRLFGKIDYKRARYLFQPEFAIGQALMVDSKAEKKDGSSTATIQTAQTSMHMKFFRSSHEIDEEGKLPKIIPTSIVNLITTTIFVKYSYESDPTGNMLKEIIIAAIPNGYLQDRYNPSASDTIWRAGRDAPSRGEAFRARLSFSRLKTKCKWRVQRIAIPSESLVWDE